VKSFKGGTSYKNLGSSDLEGTCDPPPKRKQSMKPDIEQLPKQEQ
jgi:hypothetical protein